MKSQKSKVLLKCRGMVAAIIAILNRRKKCDFDLAQWRKIELRETQEPSQGEHINDIKWGL